MFIRWYISLILILIFVFDHRVCVKACSEDSECGTIVKYQLCVDHECVNCIDNANCTINTGDLCRHNGHCEMRPFFSDFGWRDLVSTLSVLFGSAIAAGGGLGGGGVFVPIFILIQGSFSFLSMLMFSYVEFFVFCVECDCLKGFDEKAAGALSLATIFGGSIVNLAMNFRQTHPRRVHRTLADMPTILILEPMLLVGTIIGVFVNVMLPNLVILVLLVVVLGYTSYRAMKKAMELWKTENAEQYNQEVLPTTSHHLLKNAVSVASIPVTSVKLGENIQEIAEDSATNVEISHDQSMSLMSVSGSKRDWANLMTLCGLENNTGGNETLKRLTRAQLQELIALVNAESQVLWPFVAMSIIWLISSVFSIAKAGIFYKVATCSSSWWWYTFGVFPCMFIISIWLTRRLVSDFNKKIELGWVPDKEDIHWNAQKAIIYPIYAAVAGILGGLLGIGGGMLVSPLLLELGLGPRVSSATCAIAVAVTSSSGALQKQLQGLLRTDYMLFFMVVGALGTFIGQTVVNYAVKRYGRQSIVVFAVQAIITLALILMATEGSKKKVASWPEHGEVTRSKNYYWFIV
ncbi:hypothetical protein RFI_22166 [Reticulomyxa filosa]|uniref:Uncharacterized protein n=1 Tax=Reticulomyxa filosa TaxID=46433 RepID=X6MQ18_RETFI|nr:hypothetical protein RFI_22166 [Reticulomyxa filosa]|eukprot:ETO15195.1 hypothetical protein RFI_22166 [Reticulomyxa filosa]